MVEKSGVEISSLQEVNGHFNPKPFKPGLFDHELSNPGFFNPRRSLGLKSSWLKSLGLKGLGLKLGFEKSRVEMPFNQKVCIMQNKTLRSTSMQKKNLKTYCFYYFSCMYFVHTSITITMVVLCSVNILFLVESLFTDAFTKVSSDSAHLAKHTQQKKYILTKFCPHL